MKLSQVLHQMIFPCESTIARTESASAAFYWRMHKLMTAKVRDSPVRLLTASEDTCVAVPDDCVRVRG